MGLGEAAGRGDTTSFDHKGEGRMQRVPETRKGREFSPAPPSTLKILPESRPMGAYRGCTSAACQPLGPFTTLN